MVLAATMGVEGHGGEEEDNDSEIGRIGSLHPVEQEIEMGEITGGALIARCLANEGIRFVFGLPCPEVDPLLAALDEHSMRFFPDVTKPQQSIWRRGSTRPLAKWPP